MRKPCPLTPASNYCTLVYLCHESASAPAPYWIPPIRNPVSKLPRTLNTRQPLTLATPPIVQPKTLVNERKFPSFCPTMFSNSPTIPEQHATSPQTKFPNSLTKIKIRDNMTRSIPTAGLPAPWLLLFGRDMAPVKSNHLFLASFSPGFLMNAPAGSASRRLGGPIARASQFSHRFTAVIQPFSNRFSPFLPFNLTVAGRHLPNVKRTSTFNGLISR